VDVNFGDPVTPAPQFVSLPALRPDAPTIRVLGYPIETVLAEKLATAIDLGPANTRVRDYADIYRLTATHDLEHGAVRAALIETARFRGATIQPLSAAIGDLVEMRNRAYVAHRTSLGSYGVHLPERFADLVDRVVSFADPLANEVPDSVHWLTSEGRWAPL